MGEWDDWDDDAGQTDPSTTIGLELAAVMTALTVAVLLLVWLL